METRSIKEFNTRSIFARWRTNNCGESQKFNSTDAALSWVQSSTREMVESGYSKAAFTLRDEHGDVLYKGHTTKTQYSYAIFNGEEKSYKIKYKQTNRREKMKKNNYNSETSFFAEAESNVVEMAAATMNAAIASKDLSDEDFAAAISQASNGMVTLQRSANNPNRVDFCGWEPFTLTHNKKDPGKKKLDAIERTIVDTYKRGLVETAKTNDVGTASDKTVTRSGEDFIQNVVNTILVYLHQDEIIRKYLSSHSAGLDSELSSLTRGVIKCWVTDNEVRLTSITGKAVQVAIRNKSLSVIGHELTVAITGMLIQAALSSKTRNTVVAILDVDDLSELYFLSISHVEPEASLTPEQESISRSHDEDTGYAETGTTKPEYGNEGITHEYLNRMQTTTSDTTTYYGAPPVRSRVRKACLSHVLTDEIGRKNNKRH